MLDSDVIKSYLDNQKHKPAETIQASGKTFKIVSTKNFVEGGKTTIDKTPAAEVRPLNRIKLLFFVFFFVEFLGAALLVKYLLQSHFSAGIFLAICFGVLLLLFFPVFIFFRSRKSIETISISSAGLHSSYCHFSWDQLMETLIVKVHPGRIYKTYLVVVTRDQLIVVLSLKNFVISTRHLALVIEAFKQKAREEDCKKKR